MKKIITGFKAIVVITCGIIACAGCEKEIIETQDYDQVFCAKMDTGKKWYQLTLCLTKENRNGIRCENVPWKPTAFGCSGPHPCEAFTEEKNQPDGNTNDCNITADQAQNMLDEFVVEHGSLKHEKPVILHYWELFEYMHQIGILQQTPEELYESADEITVTVYE